MKFHSKIYTEQVVSPEQFRYSLSKIITDTEFLDFVKPERHYSFSYKIETESRPYLSPKPVVFLIEIEVDPIPVYTSVYKSPEDLHLVTETSFWKKLKNAIKYIKCESGVFEYKRQE